MKTRFSNFVKILFSLFLSLASLSLYTVKGSEFVIMNRVISWDINSGDAFWTIDIDPKWPLNWKSPNNYSDGLIYTRYEVLSVATNEPFGMQFAFFQYQPSGAQRDSVGELCENVRTLQGAGDVVISSSSPSTWWPGKGGVDFSRMGDLRTLCPIIWTVNPAFPLSPANAGGDPSGYMWTQRFNWFPVTVRVTVVAVSAGSEFSGWQNYIIDPGLRKPTPSFGIDYINETTDQVVPSTVEYSQYVTMSGAVSGTGQKVSVTPGKVMYFRTKAGNGLMASEIQVLRIPERPATPKFVLDKINHRTTTVVNNIYEHCDFVDFMDAVTGTGDFVAIPAGKTKYIRQKATLTTFKSKEQALSETTKLPVPHEFVIFNDYAVWPNNTDTNGFYYFYHTADMPVNWKTPENYVDGTIQIRYEVISQKTSTPIGLQFGIWQMTPPETGELHETMSMIKNMNGPGSVVYSSGRLSSGADYWVLDPYLDFTRMNLTWHFGILPWKVTSGNQQIRQENPSVWAERNTYWFPMKAYVTVVAVASGSSFSGWQNYLGVKPATPSYTINFETVKTNQAVSSTDEYSYSADMTGAVSGTNVPVSLQAGQTVYFRTKAQGIHPASDIQRLTVPARPSVPNFTIDFQNSRTVQQVSSDIEYSTTASFNTTQSGTGISLPLTPGQDLWFKMKVAQGSFPSDTFHLDVPAKPEAPGVNIDFNNETTVQLIPATIEYSSQSSMTGAASGNNSKVSLTPGSDLYFRVKSTGSSFASDITTLDVPERPSTPVITVDYISETTSPVASELEWSSNSNMTGSVSGAGIALTLTPGTDLYFRTKSTGSMFKSSVQHLIVPSRPQTPNYTINFESGRTNEQVASNVEYSIHSNMSDATPGTGSAVTLIPGTDLYFRKPATSNSFVSLIQHLIVDNKPGTPFYTINYQTLSTNEPVGSDIVYSYKSNFSTFESGNDQVLVLEPGKNLYFKKPAGISSFSSDVFQLGIPGRNFLGYSGPETVTTEKVVMYAILADQNAVLNIDDIEVENGYPSNLRAGNMFDINPSSKGNVHVVIPANSTNENSFVSNTVTVYFDIETAVHDFSSESFKVYPNPNKDGIIYVKTKFSKDYMLEIYTLQGRLLRNIHINGAEPHKIDLQDLEKGIYVLKFITEEGINMQKVFME